MRLMPALAGVQDSAPPPMPATIGETGLAPDGVEALVVKALYLGEATGLAVADRVRLPYVVIEPLMERIRAEHLVEVRGATGAGSGAYRYALTDLGRDRARQYLDGNAYIGPAPVPLGSYADYMRALGSTRGYIDRDRLRGGFAHLVVNDRLLDRLGPAVNANTAIFLHGPPGNGKTVIADGLGRAAGGDMYIPYAIDIDGAIVTLYDPASHESLDAEDPDPLSIVASAPRDRRWIRVRRPVVTVGGELTLDMLDLTFNPVTRFYGAPVQLKANGGVFLVDDFGRQRMRPEELLNRWIVPLESRIDYLTLQTGRTFEVPFDMLIVFATNLDPHDLADEAFLRRIPYKIPIEDPTLEEFTRIFELNCRRRQLHFDQFLVAYLERRHYRPFGRPLRACQPRDLLDQVTALCRYRGIPPAVTREFLDAACEAYFLDQGTSHKSQGTRHKAMS
ncbi:MAG: ATP-binding protein [Acidobacteria bacterium]|nr:ATP-binding protein [Acidobacteriota bacterium]